jgi:hypothetical protein
VQQAQQALKEFKVYQELMVQLVLLAQRVHKVLQAQQV